MPIALVVAAILVTTSNPAAAAEDGWVPLSIDAAGAAVVPVSINSGGPFRFLLDTGSSHSVISQSLANRLGLEPIARTEVLTSTGVALRPVVRLDLTTIGSARSEGLLASLVPSRQLEAIAGSIEGIIGQDFLFAFNYTLDYRERRLSWTDCGAAKPGARLPLVAQGGRYLVQVLSGRTKPPVLLVLDSGASGLVLFARDGQTRIPLDRAPDRVTLRSLSGRQDVRTMLLRELKLGSATIRDQLVAVIDRDRGDMLEGDGLLPLHLFDSVTFNAREGYVVIGK